jgi:hypothetical protein
MVIQRAIDARGERLRVSRAMATPLIGLFGGAFVLPAFLRF